MDAGHVVPSQQESTPVPHLEQSQVPLVQIQLQEMSPVTSGRTTGHKRSSHDLEADFDPARPIIDRVGTPPKRARTADHDRSVSSSPGVVIHKRSSEELEDIQLAKDDGGKRARKESGGTSPPMSLSVSLSATPSDEGPYILFIKETMVLSTVSCS